jgi:hypothetical protein
VCTQLFPCTCCVSHCKTHSRRQSGFVCSIQVAAKATIPTCTHCWCHWDAMLCPMDQSQALTQGCQGLMCCLGSPAHTKAQHLSTAAQHIASANTRKLASQQLHQLQHVLGARVGSCKHVCHSVPQCATWMSPRVRQGADNAAVFCILCA